MDMTREEAIKQLTINRPSAYTDLREAIDMAINVLEQEPCEDAISRETVIDLIADYELSMGQVVAAVHNLPPVTRTRKVGKWIEKIYRDDYNDYEEEMYECSQCHEEVDKEYPYCPYCTIKMEVSEDE